MDALRERPEPDPGGQRRPSARHPLLLPGHARHPLRLRLPHRRAWPPSPSTTGWSPRAAWATTSTAACRLLATDLEARRRPTARSDAWSTSCSGTCPSGVGSSGAIAQAVARRSWSGCWSKGAGWAVERGLRLARTTWTTPRTAGALPGADPAAVSERAYARGQDQVGTLGSGNHFLEVQVVDEVFDREAAAAFGLREGQITVMIHCGSRGFGYQVCDDYLAVMAEASRRYGIDLPDRQLACAPVDSPEGRALPGRHGLRRQLRLGQPADDHASRPRRRCSTRCASRPRSSDLRLVYDVAHNIAKLETHEVDGARGAGLRAPQGRHPGLRPRPARGAGRLPRRSDSRCSSRATWARPRSCARAPRRP